MRPIIPILARPVPDRAGRQVIKKKIRNDATGPLYADVLAFSNGDEERHAPHYPLQFTKGLEHDEIGLVQEADYVAWVKQVNIDYDDYQGDGFKNLKTGKGKYKAAGLTFRGWESPRSGHAYDLQGPDSAEVAMAPAPKLGSDELIAEMAEVYGMALLRDFSFSEIGAASKKKSPAGISPHDVIEALSKVPGFQYRGFAGNPSGGVTKDNVFRGSTVGANSGPYLSQFLLQGSKNKGEVGFGGQTIDLKTARFPEGRDYMVHWHHWLDVQNGADVGDKQKPSNPDWLRTPRDMASYVRVDALYQAYLIAALTMDGAKLGFSSGFPSGGKGENRASFATFGGPHMLALLTEVSTRALKAVRRQKFNIHRRCRPERLAAMLTLVANGKGALGSAEAGLKKMLEALEKSGLAALINKHNAAQDPIDGMPEWNNPDWLKTNLMLPMAFIEGSPMHPSYGAGHATVAGACITVLKAFFETATGDVPGHGLTPLSEIGMTPAKLLDAGGDALANPGIYPGTGPLTISGELDKLAANISIGRNMAGVHFYSDYFDSLRMGERIATGILYEQLATYGEPVTMRFESFDGDRVVLSSSGPNGADNGFPRSLDATINTASGQTLNLDQWWSRHVTVA